MAQISLAGKLSILADAAKVRCLMCLERSAKTRFYARSRDWLNDGLRHLPFLRAGWPVHIALEDPAHKLLHV